VLITIILINNLKRLKKTDHKMLKIYNNYDNNKLDFYVIIFFVKNKLDEDFIKSLVVIASGICRGNDPYELVNGAFEYLKKNWNKYEEHPNLKAIAVLKMKGLFIDEIRKNKNFENNLVNEDGSDIEISDSSQIDIVDKIQISTEYSKVLKIIQSMGDKCREILMLAADEMDMREMQIKTEVNSLGTVLSRLSNCRKELRERMLHA
jgi:DNA-directed RNA polymerase specialized sigma24 family protein